MVSETKRFVGITPTAPLLGAWWAPGASGAGRRGLSRAGCKGSHHCPRAACTLLCALVSCMIAACLLSGCKGSSGGGSAGAPASSNGTVQVSVTDAAQDDIESFEVDIVSIDLVKRNGAKVHTLPITTRVDFADLVEVAELLTAASVPNGIYVKAEMTLDFSNAAIRLAGADTDAAVLDVDGDPLTGRTKVSIDLESGRRLIVAPGVPRILTIDFDLDASTEVDLAANTVKVSPVLIADVDLERSHDHRVRGPLLSVDVSDASFLLDLRPFRAVQRRFGRVRVQTGAGTQFEINGQSFEGTNGVAAMSQLTPLTAVIAVGRFDVAHGTFDATEVLAGSSVPGGTLDVVRGHVTARSGNTLTLIGAELDRSDGSITRNAQVTIELDPTATIVTKQLSMDPRTTQAVSVGQHIAAFGRLSGSPGSFVLSPTERVRLLRTKLRGVVTAAGPSSLTLSLQHIGHRRISIFDFSGTGPGGDEANPASYAVSTGALDLTGLDAGSPVRVFGFVSSFGSAPPDFEAVTVVDVAAVGAVMAVVCQRDSDEQVALGESEIALDLADSPVVHHVDRSGVATDLTTLTGASVEAASDGAGLFVIVQGGTVTIYRSFEAFLDALNARIASGKDARSLTAKGHFDDATGELTASTLTVVLR